MIDVTVLTAALPQRASMLAEAVVSVATQTTPPAAHLVSVDLNGRGAAAVYNDLAAGVETEWLTFLDDDDLLDPHHLESLWGIKDDAEVAYSDCHVEGGAFGQYGLCFDSSLMSQINLVPITAMVRTEWFHKVGGFPQEWGYDWRLWQRIDAAGGRFRQLRTKTWTYRFHGANQSREGVR